MTGTLNESIYEDGNGGSLLLRSYEIVQTNSLAILAYLLMFGGNVNEITKKENSPAELSIDWWGNKKIDNSSKWINSETEKFIRGIALTSRNRSLIEQTVKRDVKSLEEFGKITVDVTYPELNRLKILITIKEPSAKNSTSLALVWDSTKNEVIEQNIL